MKTLELFYRRVPKLFIEKVFHLSANESTSTYSFLKKKKRKEIFHLDLELLKKVYFCIWLREQYIFPELRRLQVLPFKKSSTLSQDLFL